MAARKKWIQKLDLKKGAFTRQAKQRGMSVPEFTRYVLEHKEKFDTTTLRRALLAKRFQSFKRKK